MKTKPEKKTISDSGLKNEKSDPFSPQSNILQGNDLPKSVRSNGTLKNAVETVDRPVSLTSDELSYVTILTGGLSPTHNRLLEGGLINKGFKCLALDNADKKSSDIGREYGNNGLCNPAYFTTGNLIKYLQQLEEDGMSKAEIIKNYVFLTAGCGDSPCRFGMYESQFKNALKNAGFKGFRVLVVEQAGGMHQDQGNLAIKFDMEFFLMVVNIFNIGDLLNSLAFSIKPYEINEGQTDQVLDESTNYMRQVFIDQPRIKLNPFFKAFWKIIGLKSTARFLQLLGNQLSSKYLVKGLEKVRKDFERIEVDRLRVKPIVKITGEFWATVTQGDGNYKMYQFLDNEGVEIKPEYTATYVDYLLFKNLLKLKNKRPAYKFPFKKVKAPLGTAKQYFKKYLALYIGEKLFLREFNRLRKAIGGTLHQPMNQKLMAEVGHPYYHTMLSGGEGHMEVAKNILYHEKNLAHMVLSVKPFGCMPSTISDGVQVKLTERFKDMIFIPIETSGDGEINAYSRIQMALFDARAKANDEWDKTVDSLSYSIESMKQFIDKNQFLKNPLYKVPHKPELAGIAANFATHVNELMNTSLAGK
jgi:predicted nucleotide-binding protein (sugar kinase/HSP70/actin superfamily)